MNSLESLLCEMIAENGPLSLETYMAMALNHPMHGYYVSKMPLGRSGDFITAPEISQMFGELIGLWCIAVWRSMGGPKPVRLIELGPGRGTLMADALRAARLAPDFLSATAIDLVESNGILRACQHRALADTGCPVKWHAAIEELPDGPAIIVANEFFDCLPVRQFVRTSDGWHERLVGLNGAGRLSFGLATEPVPGVNLAGEPGEVFEAGLAAVRMMLQLAARICKEGGALLVIDYGYDAPKSGATLQAVRSHRFVGPLEDPGETDLTAHVDFSALMRAARAAGAAVHGPVPQGAWLTRLGLYERAAKLREKASASQNAAIDLALERLAGEGQGSRGESMARLFNVLAVTVPGHSIPPGFETTES
jgi:NADH dehydrogenase [ubiquinone] 1 alpha subcomplex assembly factor 7